MNIPVTSQLKQNKTYFYYKLLSLSFSYSKPCYLSIIASTETKITTNVVKPVKNKEIMLQNISLFFCLLGWLFFPIHLLIHSSRSFGLG